MGWLLGSSIKLSRYRCNVLHGNNAAQLHLYYPLEFIEHEFVPNIFVSRG